MHGYLQDCQFNPGSYPHCRSKKKSSGFIEQSCVKSQVREGVSQVREGVSQVREGVSLYLPLLLFVQ